jgi:hypothetical protein
MKTDKLRPIKTNEYSALTVYVFDFGDFGAVDLQVSQ